MSSAASPSPELALDLPVSPISADTAFTTVIAG